MSMIVRTVVVGVLGRKPKTISSFGHRVKVLLAPPNYDALSREIRSTHTQVSATGFNDYDLEKTNFQLKVPEYYNFASDVIDSWANKEKQGDLQRGSNPALWLVDAVNGQEYKWTFQELSEKAKRTAHILQNMCGVKKGSRVIVLLPRIPEWWLINIACMRIGAVLIPGTTQLTARDIQHRLNRSEAMCVISDFETAEKVQKVVNDCPSLQTKVVISDKVIDSNQWLNFKELYEDAPSTHEAVQSKSNEPMTIFFTSGTTGNPKMTEHTHASYGLACCITGKYWLDLVPTDVHWNLSDTGWAKSAWSNIFAPWYQGACVFIYNANNFDAKSILNVLHAYPVSTFCTAPTAYRMMIQENLENYKVNSALRHCVSAGEPLNPEVIETWEKVTGQVIREGYGQTETVLQVGSFRCIPNKPGSMGKPAPGMDIRVIDNDGKETAPGVEGDISLKIKPKRPVGLFTRYVDNEDLTVASIRGDYYITGDRAIRDDDGYLWFVGRDDDVIISSGYRIGPFEVESALLEHPAVAESAVVSSPDKTRGEVVKAFVVLTESFKERDASALSSELQNHVKQTTAPYKYPRKIEFVNSLPKTVSGKIRRNVLRDQEWKIQELK